MCLAVGKLSEDEDVVITGSKDHYIKVGFFVYLMYCCNNCCPLPFCCFMEWNRTKCNYPQTGHVFISCLNTCVPKPCSLFRKKIA